MALSSLSSIAAAAPRGLADTRGVVGGDLAVGRKAGSGTRAHRGRGAPPHVSMEQKRWSAEVGSAKRVGLMTEPSPSTACTKILDSTVVGTRGAQIEFFSWDPPLAWKSLAFCQAEARPTFFPGGERLRNGLADFVGVLFGAVVNRSAIVVFIRPERGFDAIRRLPGREIERIGEDLRNYLGEVADHSR